MCKKIIFISGSRSDFGLIQSIIKYTMTDKRFKPYLIRVGHSNIDDVDFNSTVYNTLEVIKIFTNKGITNVKNNLDTSLSISEIISKVTLAINNINPDILFVPGDRFEIFAVVISAYYQKIPIAHIFGGDKSEGGHLDDNIRHSITKLAHLHFPVCIDSYNRILNLGEEEWRVYNFGSPVVDNLEDIEFKQPYDKDYVVLTYHSITNKPTQSSYDIEKILQVLSKYKFKVFITSPNNELGSEEILKIIKLYSDKYSNISYIGNLGWEKYLNYVKYSKFTIGNSSSNLLESPILGIVSINIGDRQKGRFNPASVISINCNEKEIEAAIEKALFKRSMIEKYPYGQGNVAKKVLDTIYKYINNKQLLIKRITY